jgi:hypothetical protein
MHKQMNKQMKLYRSKKTGDLEMFDYVPRDGWEYVADLSSGQPSTGEARIGRDSDNITINKPQTASLEQILRAVAKARGEIHEPWTPPPQPTPRRVTALEVINAARKARNEPALASLDD